MWPLGGAAKFPQSTAIQVGLCVCVLRGKKMGDG